MESKKPFFYKKTLVLGVLTFICFSVPTFVQGISIEHLLWWMGVVFLLAFVTFAVFFREDAASAKWLWGNWKEHITGASLKGVGKHLSKETNAFYPETDPEPFVFKVSYSVGKRGYSGQITLKGTDPDIGILLDYVPKKRIDRALSKMVVKTRILDVKSTYITHSDGVDRAVTGYIAAGTIGGILGAASATERTEEQRETTFKLWYADGHTAVEKVQNGSKPWREYIELLEED